MAWGQVEKPRIGSHGEGLFLQVIKCRVHSAGAPARLRLDYWLTRVRYQLLVIGYLLLVTGY
jgi:hypothetical protein